MNGFTQMLVSAFLFTAIITFYIIACAKNTINGNPQPNFTVLWSIGFMSVSLVLTFLLAKMDGYSVTKDWINFILGGFFASTFILPAFLFFTQSLSGLSLGLCLAGNILLVLCGAAGLKMASVGGY